MELLMVRRNRIAVALCSVVLGVTAGKASAVPVDLELALAVDVSGSTAADEFQLMINGYASAFRSSTVQDAIQSGPNARIAVSMYFWTSEGNDGLQAVKIPFTEVTRDSANALADRIADLLDPITEISTPGGTFQLDQPLHEPVFIDVSNPPNIGIFGGTGSGSGFTAVAQAITFGSNLLVGDNGFESARRVLDVSGDGHENVDRNIQGCSDPEACAAPGLVISPLDPSVISNPDLYFAQVAAARAAALAAGVTAINGLPIETDIPDLSENFYEPYVIGGDGAFAVSASGYEAFGTAIAQKLASEIAPEPGALALLALGLVSVCGARARRARAPSARGSA
jgi:hypothetical protein